MGKETLEEFLSVTKALSDAQRVRVLLSLREGELCVCQITELLKLAPSTVSKHMSVLKQAGLVESRKDSRWVYYRLSDESSGSVAAQSLQFVRSILEEDSSVVSDRQELIKILKKSDVCPQDGLGGCCD